MKITSRQGPPRPRPVVHAQTGRRLRGPRQRVGPLQRILAPPTWSARDLQVSVSDGLRRHPGAVRIFDAVGPTPVRLGAIEPVGQSGAGACGTVDCCHERESQTRTWEAPTDGTSCPGDQGATRPQLTTKQALRAALQPARFRMLGTAFVRTGIHKPATSRTDTLGRLDRDATGAGSGCRLPGEPVEFVERERWAAELAAAEAPDGTW